MSIQIGLYDFFAYTLPGFVLLAGLLYAGSISNLFPVDIQAFKDLPTPLFLAAIGGAYIVGMLIEPAANRWYRILQPKSRARFIFQEFESIHPDLKLNVRPEDAGLMRAYIKSRNLELALDIEKNGATSKMLRNFSFGFAVLSTILLVQLFFGGFRVLNLGIVVALAGMAYVAASEAAKFDRWFHYLTLESIAAFSLHPLGHVAHQAIAPNMPAEPSQEHSCDG